MKHIEYAVPGDRFYSYCLWEYAPVASVAGKLHPSTLLYQSFKFAGAGPHAFELVERLRAAIGKDRTVWGLKFGPAGIAWEFYFYDYARRQRKRSISAVLDAIAPLYPCEVPRPEDLNYFMFSLDFPLLEPPRPLEEIHVYIGNVGSTVSSGMNYSQTKAGRILENFYFFFDPRKHMELIEGKVGSSAWVDSPAPNLASIIWPELAVCSTICVANKRRNDCIYFSGVNVNQLLFAFERLNCPAPLADFVRQNHARLDHLLLDIGFDYTFDAAGLHILKSGLYGTF
jgi:hypothetical protein